MGYISWKDDLTMDDNSAAISDINGEWEAQLLAKAAGTEVESEDNDEEELGGVINT